jgi:hypothetical protein
MDRTTKILLAAIALGLWANAATTVIKPAIAQFSTSRMESLLSDIESNTGRLGRGTCTNSKLC